METEKNGQQSLLTELQINTQEERKVLNKIIPTNSSKLSLSYPFVFGFLILAALVTMAIIQYSYQDSSQVRPIHIGIPWHLQELVLQVNTSRVFQLHYFSGNDDRKSDLYKGVTMRAVFWQIQDIGQHSQRHELKISGNGAVQKYGPCKNNKIIKIDKYGRLDALQKGICLLKVRSLSNPGVQNHLIVKVVQKRTDIDPIKKRIVNFTAGQPFRNRPDNLQKIITRYSRQLIIKNNSIPQTVRKAAENPQFQPQKFQKQVRQNEILWKILNFSNGSSDLRYITRQDLREIYSSNGFRDKYQFFIGDRYLPQNGANPVMIEADGENGIWVVGGKIGDVTHIQMVQLSFTEKALKMTKQTQRCLDRYGIISDAQWGEEKCTPSVTPNDGLWTSMFSAGEFMKYQVFKRNNQSASDMKQARASAIRSLKSVLMIANVAGRDGVVKAKIRPLNNTYIEEGAFYSDIFLKKGKDLAVDTYPGNTADGISFYGNDAGKSFQQIQLSGVKRYSMMPINRQDWSQNKSEEPALTQRSLEGFIVRNFVVTGAGDKLPGGLVFQRNTNGTQTVKNGSQVLYQFQKNQNPILSIGDKDIPKVLKDLLLINGTQYQKSDIAYTADTSTDSIIAHFFLYKIAFDILDPENQQQKELIKLIQETMQKYCQHLVNNGYMMVDATGLGTKWIKLNHQFLTSDYVIQDCPLKAIELILGFKLAYYVTGQAKWKQQYDFLTNKRGDNFRQRGYGFDYLDLVSILWEKQVWTSTNNAENGMKKMNFTKNPSQKQIQRHVLHHTHFSDQQEAFLAIYLAFQLQEDQRKLQLFKKNVEGYWKSVSHSQNPLWYLIYQLCYPNQRNTTDSFERNILQTAVWSLSRHPIDTRGFQAYIHGARNDTLFEGFLSVNPNKVIDRRKDDGDMAVITIYSNENKKIYKKYDPMNIYDIKVLPPDQRSIHKFNGATFSKIDQNHSPNTMEAATLYTLPYWLGVYHNMIQYHR